MLILAVLALIILVICVFSPPDSKKMTDYDLYGTDDPDEYAEKMRKERDLNR